MKRDKLNGEPPSIYDRFAEIIATDEELNTFDGETSRLIRVCREFDETKNSMLLGLREYMEQPSQIQQKSFNEIGSEHVQSFRQYLNESIAQSEGPLSDHIKAVLVIVSESETERVEFINSLLNNDLIEPVTTDLMHHQLIESNGKEVIEDVETLVDISTHLYASFISIDAAKGATAYGELQRETPVLTGKERLRRVGKHTADVGKIALGGAAAGLLVSWLHKR